MIRQTHSAFEQDFALISRLRFQLVVMWLVAVGLPTMIVSLGIISVETERAAFNSMIGATLALLLGVVAFRRVIRFPGVKSYSLIMPSMAGAFGFVIAVMLIMRLSYSRTVLIGSFLLAVVMAFLLAYLAKRFLRPRFHVVPGGDADALRSITEADWELMEEPTLPTSPRAMLVADFRHDHDSDWERMLAQTAISGRIVYHSKVLRESLTGRVLMEHLSENSFGSLLPSLAYCKMKRFLDILLCLFVIPLLALPMLAIAILIKFDSPGPIIFRQNRMGYRGEVFVMYKFRSMRERDAVLDEMGARDDAMTREADDRITSIGRFIRRIRFDELPQIANILRGEMSWIGPRPEAVKLSEWYEAEIPFYSYRHIVRPGLTGWAQVNQGHVTDLEAVHDKLAYDFYYVKYFSAWLDLVVLARTVPTVLGGFGAR